jgi:hypothetical protein
MIIQQAVKHWNGTFLVTTFPEESITYEDAKGNVITMKGGNDFFSRTKGFPGFGCEDYSLTILDKDETVLEKVLVRVEGTWKTIRELTYEELKNLDQQVLSPSQLAAVAKAYEYL